MKILLWVLSQFAVLLVLFALQGSFVASYSLASEDIKAVKIPSVNELHRGIADRLIQVEEFRFIKQEAAKLGVRAWLFGGTAAGYAHYVKWDLQRERGDKRFQPDRFDYDYTNIYRSTQDLDIVIDGNASQAQDLQKALTDKYPHLQGSKTAWEVRLLTQDMGDKQAILNNPDFMNQHTDSNSTGLIEITEPKSGASIIRDVRNWNSKEPHFLKDVHDGALHYYFSPSHHTTKFAKEGRNPPILSAIRYLTKAFQYELELRPEDLAHIRQVIKEFDPHADARNPYVANWIEKNGKKLIQNAVNIEYAWNTLETLGLRKKLAAIKNNTGEINSLAWWMNREPLRTRPVGGGFGRTSRELGLDIVAHETKNFLAYESITRAHTGDPNVLISRDATQGEAAAHGDGFYTRVGQEGARGTGLTIRFHLDPNARTGADFDLVGDYVVIKNKSAIRVIPETLNIGPVEYFRLLESSETFDKGDLGIIEKLKRRIHAKYNSLTKVEESEIVEIVRSELEKPLSWNSSVLQEWFAMSASARYPELAEMILRNGQVGERFVVTFVLSQPHWAGHVEWAEHILNTGESDPYLVQFVLSKPHWKDHPEWIEKILSRPKGGIEKELIMFTLSQEHWKSHPEFVERLLDQAISQKDSQIGVYIPQSILSKPYWKRPDWLKRVLDVRIESSGLPAAVFSQPMWSDHPELLQQFIDQSDYVGRDQLATHALSKSHWRNHPEFIEQLLNMGGQGGDPSIAQHILSDPYWSHRPDWIEKIIKNKSSDEWIEKYVLSKPHWRDHPELRRLTGGAEPTLHNLRDAFERGLTLMSKSNDCIKEHLAQSLH